MQIDGGSSFQYLVPSIVRDLGSNKEVFNSSDYKILNL